MTEEQFREFTDETIPCALFHVDFEDKDDETGAKLDEVILIGLLNENLDALIHRPLSWFVQNYIYEEPPDSK